MKRYIVLAALSLFVFALSAAPVSRKKAEKVAVNLYFERASLNHPMQRSDIRVTEYFPLSLDNTILIHGFQINHNQGFVLVAADDASIPVLGYSPEGRFNSQDMPENVASWIRGYMEQLQQIREEQFPADAENTALWDRYSSSMFTPSKDITGVSPLLTTNWDQGCYYNSQCPVASGGDCNRVWVGCVATAMGMIMKYHNYPPMGIGSHSYTHPTYGAQTANFGSTTYNWNGMPNQLFSNNTAVSTLLYHCGVSVEMNYGVSGSGAYTNDARDALVEYFNYDTNTLYGERMWYSPSNWEGMMRSDLDGHRPVLYAGQDPSYGHAFVCDGYQGTNYFHFNWGWSGWNNGYFYISNLNSGNGTFNNAQKAVFHIAPAPAPTANFTAVNTNHCGVDSVQFTDASTGNPTSWVWQFPGGNPSSSNLQNPLVSYSTNGTYNVTLTVTNSYSSHTTIKYSFVNAHPLPLPLFPHDTTICCNNTITLNAGNPGSTYLWSTGATTQTIQVDTTGIGIGSTKIKVDILTQNSCFHQDSILITFAACTGIEENNVALFNCYPNPSTGNVILQHHLDASLPATVTVYDAQGSKSLELPLADLRSQEIMLDLNSLRNGLYFICLTQDGKVSAAKLLLLR